LSRKKADLWKRLNKNLEVNMTETAGVNSKSLQHGQGPLPAPLRVMHVMGGRVRSGVDSVVLSLAEALQQAGGEPIITPLWEGFRIAKEAEEKGFIVDSLDKRRRYDLLSIPRLARLIRKNRVHILHSHEANAAFYAGPAARMAGVAHVNSYHLDVRDSLKQVYRKDIFIRLTRRYYLWLMQSCDRVITVAPSLKLDVISGGVPKEKVVFIPTAIDLEAYDPACPEQEAVRKELGISPDETVIGTACRLQLVKNLPLLLHAGKRLLEAGEKVRVVIAGEGGERENLEKMAEDLGIASCVCFTGFRNDLHRLMSAFDIFALTSKGEGMPIAILEAMALCKPVVATDVGGVNACVDHGRTGLLVPSGDQDRMADSLLSLVRDRDRARSFGETGRERVEREFTKPTMFRKTMDVYEEIMHTRGA